jgi:hypothetical protein
VADSSFGQWSAGRPRPATTILDGQDARRSTAGRHANLILIEVRAVCADEKLLARWLFREPGNGTHGFDFTKLSEEK